MIKLKTMKQTILACPLLMEGVDVEDRPVWIRYRGGQFKVYHGEYGNVIFHKEIGDPLDGYMEVEEVKTNSSEVLDWSECNVTLYPENEYDAEMEDSFTDWLTQKLEQRGMYLPPEGK